MLATKWLLGVAVCVGSAFASYLLSWMILKPFVGTVDALAELDPASPLAACLEAWVPNGDCAASAVMFISLK